MPFYCSKGNIPPKRHTAFKKQDGSIHYEELVSREGFSSIYSNLYHLRRPTSVKTVGKMESIQLVSSANTHRARHIKTSEIKSSGDAIKSRTPLLFNEDVTISTGCITNSMDYFYRNGSTDEIFYIQSGSAALQTNLGDLDCNSGDYIVIPRGIIWQLHPSNELRLLVIESAGPVETPSRYRNRFGQLLEHSPFCERDINTPTLQDPIDTAGEFVVKVKSHLGIQDLIYDHHPFDVVGWDGYYFPWKFSIHDFEPIVGSIHQPPPVHQTFQANGFVVCSFVPRLFDFHPHSIPAPYPHSNVDSDEVIYYSRGDFMSRQGIQTESITLHPMGLPHGPQPGKYATSQGNEKTDELAVMIDTLKPLKVTHTAQEIDDADYPKSWLD